MILKGNELGYLNCGCGDNLKVHWNAIAGVWTAYCMGCDLKFEVKGVEE